MSGIVIVRKELPKYEGNYSLHQIGKTTIIRRYSLRLSASYRASLKPLNIIHIYIYNNILQVQRIGLKILCEERVFFELYIFKRLHNTYRYHIQPPLNLLITHKYLYICIYIAWWLRGWCQETQASRTAVRLIDELIFQSREKKTKKKKDTISQSVKEKKNDTKKRHNLSVPKKRKKKDRKKRQNSSTKEKEKKATIRPQKTQKKSHKRKPNSRQTQIA